MSKKFGYYLKRPNDDKTVIKAKMSINGTKFYYSTGQSTYTLLWDKSRQRPTRSKKLINKIKKVNPHIESELENLNTSLENLQFWANRYFNDRLLNRDNINLKEFKIFLDKNYKNVVQSDFKRMTFTVFATDYVNNLDSYTTSSNDRRTYSKQTIQGYVQFLTKWNLFQKKTKTHDWEDIDLATFYNKYIDFLKSQGLGINTIGKHIKNLKAIMREGYEKGYHKNLDFDSRNFKTLKKETKSIYLNTKEISSIYSLELSGKDEVYRDIFLIGCKTAQRISDYANIGPHSIKTIVQNDISIEVLDIIQQKTKTNVKIPLGSTVKTILSKYPEGLPKIHHQKLNERIKMICKMAQINDRIMVDGEYQPKWSLVSSHTARRTGATLMYLSGMSLKDIMVMTGHKTERTLLSYIKITNEETAAKMSTDKFFTTPILKVVG